jgi:hypothetical protein
MWGYLRPHSVIYNDIHISSVNLSDEGPPVIEDSVVRVQECEIQGTVTIARPRLVDERTSCEVETLVPHQPPSKLL